MVRNQASIELKITKCTTIGPPRIGKTCLKHLLTGQEWDIEAGTASTDVMEAPEWVECYSVEEGGAEELWELVSKEQQCGELIRAVNTSTTSKTKPTTTPSEASSTTPPSDATSMTTSSDAMSSDAPFETTPSSAPPPNSKPDAAQKPATVRQALEALAGACSRKKLQDFLKDKEGKVLGTRRLIHFIDTGGQDIYHDIHPVLITSPSVYLVVFSLKDFHQKNYELRLSYFKSELIQRPLRSIYTFGTKTPQDKGHLEFHPEAPKILVVGTHLDQIPQDSQKDFLETVDEMIKGEISSKPYHQFVQYDTEGRSFWAVDNTKAGREQDEDAKEYISTLRLMVQDRSMEMSVKVPLPWMLLKMVMEGKGVRYCKYSELLKEARIRGYVREHSADADLDTMLRLFHILGLIYHKVPGEYNKEDSLVFVDPDCLYSATSDFLMAAKEEIEDSQGGSEEGQHQTHAKRASSPKRGSHEVHHQIPTLLTQPNMESTRRRQPVLRLADPFHMSKCQEAPDLRPLALRRRDSATSQKPRQIATISKDLGEGIESMKVGMEIEDSQGGSEQGQHLTQAATMEETEDNQGGSEEGRHQTQAATKEETEDSQGGSEEGQHQTRAATMEETEDNQGGSEEGRHQTQDATMKKTADSQGGSDKGQHRAQAAAKEETEDNQGGREEGQHQTQAATVKENLRTAREAAVEDPHQICTPLMQPSVNLAGGKQHIEPFDMSKHQTAPLRPLALTESDSATSQKPRQTAPVRKGLGGGVESVKVVQRISNNTSDFLFHMHTVLCSLERVVMNVGQEPPEVVSQNLMKIQEGVEEKSSSLQDANTLQSKYRILAKEMVFRLMNTVREVLQSSMPEDQKPQLDSVMKDFWFQCRMSRRSIEVDDFNHLLLLLTELRIIAGLNWPKCFLIPAALPQRERDLTPEEGDVEPLLFTLISQDDLTYYLPSGLFCCLISELVTELGWTVDPRGRTHVAFTHKDLTGRVHVIEHESYIEIKLELALQDKMVYNKVREKVDERINHVYSMIYDPPESRSAVAGPPEPRSVVLGFKCNCGRDNTPHLAAYEEDEFECCTRCLLQGSTELHIHPLTQQQLVWFRL